MAEALQSRRPVVALESAVVTSGLPRRLLRGVVVDSSGWRGDRPVNLEVALLMQRAVCEAAPGAVPAMVAVIDGVLRIGLCEDDIERLALDERFGKASISNLAACCAAGETAGTTVSATLHACSLANVSVFATGGIGGVHRGAGFDISADLLQLNRTPALVVSSGAKSVLDVPATHEALQTLGVPVLGYGTDQFPQFYSVGDESLYVRRVETVKEAAAICRSQWTDLRIRGGILLANPVPAAHALDAAEIDRFVEQAERDASERGINGANRTPFLLEELARLSGGRTLRANIALLESNARLAAEVAAALND